jgi:hypothetical protein
MTTKREYQRKEKRLRKNLLEKHKKFERSKSYWKKIFDKAYPPKTDHEPGWLWRQMELAKVDYEMLPEWEKDLFSRCE